MQLQSCVCELFDLCVYVTYTETNGMFCPKVEVPMVPNSMRLTAAGPLRPELLGLKVFEPKSLFAAK